MVIRAINSTCLKLLSRNITLALTGRTTAASRAQEQGQIDELGNIWVEFGADQGEVTVFVAHMDEVGWEISDIAAGIAAFCLCPAG